MAQFVTFESDKLILIGQRNNTQMKQVKLWNFFLYRICDIRMYVEMSVSIFPLTQQALFT